jgi:hypothetical protein
MLPEDAKRWMEAGKALAIDPTARVKCPICVAPLTWWLPTSPKVPRQSDSCGVPLVGFGMPSSIQWPVEARKNSAGG